MTEPPDQNPDGGAPVPRSIRWPQDLDEVRRRFAEYRQWVDEHRDPSPASRDRVNAGLQLIDSLVADLRRAYGPPRGDILLWFEGQGLVACGALRELEPGIGEIRRIYVRDDFRGKEFGRPFVRALMERARQLGYRKLRADALPTMRAAIEFYEELGFHRTTAYWPHPAAGALFFERDVEAPAATR